MFLLLSQKGRSRTKRNVVLPSRPTKPSRLQESEAFLCESVRKKDTSRFFCFSRSPFIVDEQQNESFTCKGNGDVGSWVAHRPDLFVLNPTGTFVLFPETWFMSPRAERYARKECIMRTFCAILQYDDASISHTHGGTHKCALTLANVRAVSCRCTFCAPFEQKMGGGEVVCGVGFRLV